MVFVRYGPGQRSASAATAGRHGVFYGLLFFRPSNSGNSAKFATMRRACLQSQHFRQLRDVGGDAPSLVVGQQVRRPASARPPTRSRCGLAPAVLVADDVSIGVMIFQLRSVAAYIN